jgi:hypothetical protein
LTQLPQYSINPDYAKKCLDANKHNNITTTYYLLVKKLQTQGRKGIVDPNSSLDSKSFFTSVPKIYPDSKKALNESMKLESSNNKSCNMNETFYDKYAKDKDKTNYSKHIASVIGYSSAKAGGKSETFNFALSSANRTKDKKNCSFLNDDDFVEYRKKSDIHHYPKNSKRTAENTQQIYCNQRRGSNNKRNISCRDRKSQQEQTDWELNKSAIQYADEATKTKTTRVGKQDWSFELLTECSGNGNLQKIYDLYQQQVFPSTSVHNATTSNVMQANHSNLMHLNNNTNMHPFKDSDDDLRHNLVPAQQHNTRKNHRIDTAQNKRNNAKSTSPCHNVYADSDLRSMTRALVQRKAKEVLKESQIRDCKAVKFVNPKLKTSGDANMKKQPITIIQAPLINNINNYNNIHIGTFSINQADSVQPNPPSPVPPAPVTKVNNFRLRKYKEANSNNVN